MTEASFLELQDRHCRGGRVADSARRLGLPKDNDKSNSCNGLVIIMMIDEDKTKILIVMMLCKGGRSAASAGRPTQPMPMRNREALASYSFKIFTYSFKSTHSNL